MSDEYKLSSNRLLELDALRGIACLSVVIFHFNVNQPGNWHWMNLGVAGVDLFFIISGFVIFYSLQQRYDFKGFVISRFSRLYPAYWVSVCLTSVLVIINGGKINGYDFFVNLTMLQGYFQVEDIDGAYWTLGIELFFYGLIILPFVLKKAAHIEQYIWGALPAVYLWHFWGMQYFPNIHDRASRMFQFVNHAPLFFAGIFFYFIAFQKATPIRYFGILVCFTLSCYLHSFYGRTQWVITFPEHVWLLLLYFGAFFLLISNHLNFLVNRITLFLGKISYSLYLIHQRIGTEILRPILKKYTPANTPNWIYSIALILISIILAYAITVLVEVPCMKYIRKKWGTKKPSFRTEVSEPVSA
ncbi:MAG: acyltransferase [Spirosomataceae bacterium]